MECIFADVMNKALLSIGTNMDREANLALCHEKLDSLFAGISYSKTSVTPPYGMVYKDDFLNQLAIIYTTKTKDEVYEILKIVEKQIGRNNTDKAQGKVKIDIDLIIWNDEVLKPADLSRSYIADLLPSLEE